MDQGPGSPDQVSQTCILHCKRKLLVIVGFEHVGDSHRCNVCSCEFTEDEGGVLGYFGILPVAFCPTCYSSMVDMVSQDLQIEME